MDEESAGQRQGGPDAITAASVVALIDIATVRRELANPQRARRYIGASSIGNPCLAYQALSLRGFPNDLPSPQLMRIFGEGHRIESMVVADLRASGHTVEDIDPATGRQWEYTDMGGHCAAHLDGFITPLGSKERMTLEIKSMNRKLFESFKKKGLALSHPEYVDQVIEGIALARIGGVTVDKGMVVAFCKDNAQYHAEVIPYNGERADVLDGMVVSVVLRGKAKRISASSREYGCSECFKRTSCWKPNVAVADRGCHHCANASPKIANAGKHWRCVLGLTGDATSCPSFKLFEVTPHV